MTRIITHQTAAGLIDSCPLCEHRVDAHSAGAYLGVHHGARESYSHTCLSPLDEEYRWYRVIGAGLDGSVARDADSAWASFERAAARRGYAPHEMGTARAAHSARLIEATTRAAAADAHLSSTWGRVRRGVWRGTQ